MCVEAHVSEEGKEEEYYYFLSLQIHEGTQLRNKYIYFKSAEN